MMQPPPLPPFGDPLSEASNWIETLPVQDLLVTTGQYAYLVREIERMVPLLPQSSAYLEHVRQVHAHLAAHVKALPVTDAMQFTIQRISALDGTSYRITHTESDSQVAMCADYLNAVLVTEALNKHVSNYRLLLVANGRGA